MHKTMRVRHSVLIFLFLAVAILSPRSIIAQNPIEDAIKQLSSSNVEGYLQPFVNSFGANLNSGVYHSASISDMGLAIRLDIVGMGTVIGDPEKTYDAVAPFPFGRTPAQTATLFGGLGSVVNGPAGTQYQFQNGQVKTNWVLLAVPQLTVGDIYGTEAVIRYVPVPEIQNFPKTTLFGIGVRHSISRYLPMVPVDLAATVFYQKLTIGDLLEAKAFDIGAQVSKSFSILTLYGGLQVESSSMDVSYTYAGYAATPNTQVNLSIDGENKFRATAGLCLDLIILHLYADVNAGKVTVVSGGVGFGI